MSKSSPALSYVLITPARNEEAFIEGTIQSLVSQLVLPKQWIVVSDGSTDRTDEIVQRYAKDHDFIQLIRMPEHRDRNFAAKVTAFNAGYRLLQMIDYDIIGNLDADITFGPDYFEYLLSKFAEIPDLGVAGTPFVEGEEHYDYRFTNIEHVSGACQLFRRKCFEEIGGYQPIRGGGIDWTAVTTARMKGWKTRTFTDKVCHHHRKIGTGNNNRLLANYKHGQKDYFLGGHPAWQLCRSLYQATKKPYLVGGMLLLMGYLSGAIKRVERPVPAELIQFHRNEQMARLRRFFLPGRNTEVETPHLGTTKSVNIR